MTAIINRREYLRQPVGRNPVREALDGVLRAMPFGAAGKAMAGAGGGAIPDTDMFSNPIYQWNAEVGIGVSDGQTASSWDDRLASVTASANGGPTYRANQGGFKAVEYDSTDDGHDFAQDPSLPTGGADVTFAATVWAKSSHTGAIASYGQGNTLENALFELRSDGVVRVVTDGGGLAETTGTYPTGEWMTVAAKMSSGSEFAALLNGGNKGTDGSPGTLDLQDANRSFGYYAIGNSRYADIYLYDLVISAAYESDTAIGNYHDDRVGA